jgi:hypothetical protein
MIFGVESKSTRSLERHVEVEESSAAVARRLDCLAAITREMRLVVR